VNSTPSPIRLTRNVALYPWFKFCQNLIFWQAIWFLYFQKQLSGTEAILLYVVYDVATTVLEVPSGYLSDRKGRRLTLLGAATAGFGGATLLVLGDSFLVFGLAQMLLGLATALASGTDSAILYESLAALGRERDVEKQELRAWRHAFCGLAISAVAGGVFAVYSNTLPFLAGAVAFFAALVVVWCLVEPPRSKTTIAEGREIIRLRTLKTAFTNPVLVWLLVLSVLMYVFSHITFVFGQPFILVTLREIGFEEEAPIVSGLVSALMMVLSVTVSVLAPKLRQMMGLSAILLLAFALQIVLSSALAITNHAVVVAFLLLRMVPDSLSQPFLVARIHPLLNDESRATYMSLQSLAGRLLLAATLTLASLSTTASQQLAYAEMQQILIWYVVAGIICFGGLAVAARRLAIETPRM